MAKGLRASVRKANKAKLRATVFGPAADERTKRLSAKLHEIVSQPKEAEMVDVNIVANEGKTNVDNEGTGMEIDEKADANGSSKIHKRTRYKRPSKVTFKPPPSKVKRLAMMKKKK